VIFVILWQSVKFGLYFLDPMLIAYSLSRMINTSYFVDMYVISMLLVLFRLVDQIVLDYEIIETSDNAIGYL